MVGIRSLVTGNRSILNGALRDPGSKLGRREGMDGMLDLECGRTALIWFDNLGLRSDGNG